MFDTSLIVHWQDVANYLHTTSRTVNPFRLAQALRRRAYLGGGEHAAVAFGEWEGDHAPAATGLGRAGFELQPAAAADAPGPQLLNGARGALLVMGPERAACWLAADPSPRCQVWCAAPPAALRQLPGESDAVSLADLLPRLDEEAVALFVEWRSLADGVQQLGLCPDPAALTAALLRAASAVGDVATARFYAPWPTNGAESALLARLDLPQWVRAAAEVRHQPPGAGLADDALLGDLQELLEDPAAPATWVIVGCHEGALHAGRAARRQGRKVILWAPPGAVPAIGAADYEACLSHVLDLRSLASAPAVAPRPPAPAVVPPPTPDTAEPPEGSRLGTWVRLLYLVERHRREHEPACPPVQHLAGYLAGFREFGPGRAGAVLWLERARAEGMLRPDREPRLGERPSPEPAYRPDPEHPAGHAALEVPDRAIRLLHQMLRKMPWVSFKLLRGVLMREQWLGGEPYWLDDAGIDEWLNFLIQDGALLMSKEPNAENPDFPVTALRVNLEHPLVVLAIRRAEESVRLAPERAVLAIDHFQLRTQKPWLAMSTLRRTFTNLGREELQEVLRRLQGRGALLTQSYPNPRRAHATTGCTLNRDDPFVRETLARRGEIVRALQRLQRQRPWVPLGALDEELGEEWQPREAGDRLAWYALARDEGLLELEHEGPLPLGGWDQLPCRLNAANPVVRAVLARLPGGEDVQPSREPGAKLPGPADV